MTIGSPATQASACANCGTELSALALACPACRALVHRERLNQLSALATAATAAGDREAARAHWREALVLLPAESNQYQQVSARLSALSADVSDAGAPHPERTSGRLRTVGAVAAVGIFLASKLKFLVLGLTKASTLVSMFGFLAVYWSIYGWPLAAGLGVSIYIHEMGHVAMLRRLGIGAGAPLFIPGVGAFVMLRERIVDAVVDARVGLAGPVWGLGAAVAAWGAYLVTGAAIWQAIAELTGFLNLFNLIPIWQLDGARGFGVLSRIERLVVVGAIAVALAATGVGLLWIVGGVAVFRAVREEGGPGHPRTLATFCVLVLALSWCARQVR